VHPSILLWSHQPAAFNVLSTFYKCRSTYDRGGCDWQERNTSRWLQVALNNHHRGQGTGLLGGAIMGEILACASAPQIDIRVAHLHCQDGAQGICETSRAPPCRAFHRRPSPETQGPNQATNSCLRRDRVRLRPPSHLPPWDREVGLMYCCRHALSGQPGRHTASI
jgi:hypothetical protein